jgi:hypothetical protein
MNEGPMSIWFRNAMLLGALVAGVLVTRLVPTYHAPEHSVTYRSKPASVSKANSGTSGGVSGVDVNLRHIALIGSIS